MTCRIGKITMKATGTEIYTFPKSEPKSEQMIIDLICQELDHARENKVLSISITTVTDHGVSSPFVVTREGTFCELAGAVERGKRRIFERMEKS